MWRSIALVLVGIIVAATSVFSQQVLGEAERKRNREMLAEIKKEVEKRYFDPTFQGIDLNANFQLADSKLQIAKSNSESFYVIAAFLEELRDSHTKFIPPTRTTKYEYGWQMQMVGNKCLVTDVRVGSDAELKGLKKGDQILSIEGFQPTRSDYDKIAYIVYLLNPLPDINLIVQKPEGSRSRLQVISRRTQGRLVTDLTDYNTTQNLVREAENQSRIDAHRIIDLEKEIAIWKMPQFDLPMHKVDDIMNKFDKKLGLVLDLRGNGGGSEETLLRLIAHLFVDDVKIGELIRRKDSKPLIAKSVGKGGFQGKLAVLVDSKSGSASEILARVVQMKKRGIVIGDKTDGKVMRSMMYSKQIGMDVVVLYGVSITDADLRMDDGVRLEKIGVTPDEAILPSQSEIADSIDPVLARGVKAVGMEITPKFAGTLFPFVWK